MIVGPPGEGQRAEYFAPVHGRIRRTFDCILPALERLRLPVPLRGTSNRAVLDAVGGILTTSPRTRTSAYTWRGAAGTWRAGVDDMGGGAPDVSRLARPAHALAQGLDATTWT